MNEFGLNCKVIEFYGKLDNTQTTNENLSIISNECVFEKYREALL